MDSRLKSYLALVLCGKRCNSCYSAYQASDVHRDIPYFSGRKKQNLFRDSIEEVIIEDYAYISKYYDIDRTKYTIYKNSIRIPTVVIDIFCSKCGDIRVLELPLEYFGI